MKNLEMKANTGGGFTTGQRIGYFFLALLPILSCIMLQLISSIAVGFVVTIRFMLSGGSTLPRDEMNEAATELILQSAPISTLTYHILGIVLFGLWFFLLVRKMRKDTNRKSGWAGTVIISLFSGILLCVMANGIALMEAYIIPGEMLKYLQMVEEAGVFQNGFSVFAAVILAPVGEELLCRGVTLHFAKKAFPHFWMANIFQAALFGFIHLNWIQGIYAFALGLGLGYMREHYHSLIPAIIIHFVVNASSVTWTDAVLSEIPQTFLNGILLFLVPLVIFLMVIYCINKKENRVKEP